MSVRKHRKIGGRYHWSNCLLFDYEFLLRWMTAGYSSLTYHRPGRCAVRLYVDVNRFRHFKFSSLSEGYSIGTHTLYGD